jgi:putative copper export protein
MFYLGFLHGFYYLLASAFLGTLVFREMIVTAGGAEASSLTPWTNKHVAKFCAALLLTSLVWFACVSHDMTDSWSIGSMAEAISKTTFGWVWATGEIFLALLFALSFTRFSRIFSWLIFLLPFSFALSGHAASQAPSNFLSIAIDVLHFTAVSVWAGGIINLSAWLRRRVKLGISWSPQSSLKVIKRFSHVAMGSTGIIVVTGLLMAYRYGIDFLAPWKGDYGQLLVLKLGLFACVLAAAGVNQFVHIRTWNPAKEFQCSKKVFREVIIEVALVILIFAVTGFLTRTGFPMDS